MQRSDISSINKLFVESTQKQYFVYYIRWNKSNWSVTATKTETKSGDNIDNVAVELLIKKMELDDSSSVATNDPLEVYKAKDASGVLITRESEDDMIFVSSVQMDEDDILGIYDMTIGSASYKQIDYTQRINSFKYKKAALHGTNDEAGLSTILDVL